MSNKPENSNRLTTSVHEPNPRKITVLKCKSNVVCKQFDVNLGTSRPITPNTFWQVRQYEIPDTTHLIKYINLLSKNSACCVVNGQPIKEWGKREKIISIAGKGFDYRRAVKSNSNSTGTLEDRKIQILPLDIDGADIGEFNPNTVNISDAINKVLKQVGLASFQDYTVVWAWTAKVMSPVWKGDARLRLWYILKAPVDLTRIEAWAKQDCIKVDASIYGPQSIIYTASPQYLKDGVLIEDPIKQRTGILEGFLGDELPITPFDGIKAIESKRFAKERKDDAYIVKIKELGLYKSFTQDGKHNIECPWSNEHTCPDNLTTVQYWESNFDGRTSSVFKCLHASHLDKNIGDFSTFLFGNEKDNEGDKETREEIKRLAELDMLKYGQQRKEASEKIGVNLAILDKVVDFARKDLADREEKYSNEIATGVAPYEDAVNGEELLDTFQSIFNQYLILPKGADVALSIWALGTYCYSLFKIFPRICISAPQKRCGKSNTSSVLGSLCNKKMKADNVSTAALFRSINLWKPTFQIDEGDTFIGIDRELTGVLNAGHEYTGAVVRCVEHEGDFVPTMFNVFCPVVISMIKTPPETLLDRSILITLKRKLDHEHVLRIPIDMDSLHIELRRKATRWAQDNIEKIKTTEVEVPNIDGDNRAQDNWLPLLTIAKLVGNKWFNKVNQALSERCVTTEKEDVSIQLLEDIRGILERWKLDKISTSHLVAMLIEMKESPWCEWRGGTPMTQNSLARLLQPFKLKSKVLRIKDKTIRGFRKSDFDEVFIRYLPKKSKNDDIDFISEDEINQLNPFV